MSLLKIVSVIGVSTIINLFSGFAKGKIMAVYFGSGCLGIWSQATNLFMTCSIISLFGLNQGLIKQISGRDKEKNTVSFIYDTLSKSVFFSLFNSLIISSVIIFWAKGVSAFFFNSNLSPSMIIFITVFLVFQVVGDVLGVFLLANKEIKRFASANILISIFGLGSFIALILLFSLRGAYLSVGIYGIITFASFYFISKPILKGANIRIFSFHTQLLKYWDFFKETLNFGALRLIQVTINPVTMLLIRSLIINKIGLTESGFFDALTRISVIYAPFITNILWSYTFPIYCENRDNRQLGNEINKFIRLSLILFIPACVILMLSGNVVVNLLFSRGFTPIIPLFYLWFLLDLFRVTSWPLNIVLIAKDKMKLAVTLEFFWNIIFLFSTCALIGRYSLKGVIFSYAMSFAVFLLINWIIMYKDYLFKFNPRTIFAFFTSAALILTCGRSAKALPDFIFIFFLGLIFFYLVLDKKEVLLIRDVIKKRPAESRVILNKNEEI